MARGRDRRRRGGDDDAGDPGLDRLVRVLDAAPAGLHDVGEPAAGVPLEWPPSLADVYLTFDGLRLFHEAIELVPAAAVALEPRGAGAARWWRVGTAWGDALWVDDAGRVWRAEGGEAAEVEAILDGTSLARWLSGAIDAEALLHDADGEFVEDAFDDDGELVPEVAEARLRARIRRDARAPGPRWALARRLAAAGDGDGDGDDPARLAEARDLLEEVVAAAPDLAWAWLDLARISERLGELDGAIDEAAEAAAAAARGGAHEAFFWAHAARLASRRGDEARRADLAARARAAGPRLVEELVAGAADNLAAGDRDAAAAMHELARALAPRDLAVLDLGRKLEGA